MIFWKGIGMNKTKITALLLILSCIAAGCKDQPEETTTSETQAPLAPSTVATTTTVATSGTTTESTEDTTSVPTPGDVTEPMILSAFNSAKLLVGDIFDANEYISYIDDHDRRPVLSVETPVDTTKPGVYETALLVTDANGNQARKSLTVRVVTGEETPTPTPEGVTPTPTPVPEPKNLDFYEFKSRYDGDIEFGIDVSKWQGDVDYGMIKQEGCSFVIIKAGTYYKGEFVFDAKYEQNLANAKAAGLKVGLYYYTPVTSEEVVRDCVDKICESLNGMELELPIAYDMEQWKRFQQYGINLQDLNGLFYAFCEECGKYGYEGMLYNSKNKLETVWDAKDHPVWLAHYTRETSYEGEYMLWQVSNVGRIPGISGDVDLNILYNKKDNDLGA